MPERIDKSFPAGRRTASAADVSVRCRRQRRPEADRSARRLGRGILDVEAEPAVAYRAVVGLGIVALARNVQPRQGQAADRRLQPVARLHLLLERLLVARLRGEQLELGVEHVEHGARPGDRLLAGAFERVLGCP